MVPDTSLSPETLAAFIDRTLSGAERDRVVAVLARGGPDYDAFVDVLRSLEDERKTQRFAPSAKRSRVASLMAVGATLVAAGVIGVVLRPHAVANAPIIGLVRQLSDTTTGAASGVRRVMTSGWEQPNWIQRRGDDSAVHAIDPRTAAIRLGRLAARLELAATAGDSTAIDATLASMRTEAPALAQGAAIITRRLDGIRGQKAVVTAADRTELINLIRDVAAAPWFDAAAWAEAARWAAAAAVPNYFSDTGAATRELYEIVARLGATDAGQRNGFEGFINTLQELARPSVLGSSGSTSVQSMLDSALLRASQ